MSMFETHYADFFDRETDTAARAQVLRLQFGVDCLEAALTSHEFLRRSIDVIRSGLPLVAAPASLSTTGASFLKVALQVLRLSCEPELHRQIQIFATSRISNPAAKVYVADLQESIVTTGQWILLPLLPPLTAPSTACVHARLGGNLQKAQSFVQKASNPDEEWQAAVNETLATGSQLPLVKHFRKYGPDASTQARLEAYLVAASCSPRKLHNRLQRPGPVLNSHILKTKDAPALVRLAEVAQEIHDFAYDGSSIHLHLDTLMDAINSLDHVEHRIFCKMAVANKMPNEAIAFGYCKREIQIELAKIQDMPRLIQPFRIFSESEVRHHEKQRYSPVQLVIQTLRARSGSFERMIDRDIAAIKAWIHMMLDKTGSLVGTELKVAQWNVAVLAILEGKSQLELEQVFFDTTANNEDLECMVGGLREAGYTLCKKDIRCGSTGGVFCGVHPEMGQVAIKSKWPNIDSRMFKSAEQNFRMAQKFSKFHGDESVLEITRSFMDVIPYNLDYEAEAKCQMAYATMFSGDPHIKVPSVFADQCTPSQVVQEFVEGKPFLQVIDALDQEQRNFVGAQIARFLFRGMKNGYFYTDMHPGNILLQDDKVCFIDYGAVIPCSPGVGEFPEFAFALADDNEEKCKAMVAASDHFDVSNLEQWVHHYARCRNLYAKPFLVDQDFQFEAAYAREVFLHMRYKDLKEGGRVPRGIKIANLRFYVSFYGLLVMLRAKANWYQILREEFREELLASS